MNDDLDVFIKTIFLEAGSTCGIEECLALSWVIRNRTKRDKKNYSEICLKAKQFSCWNNLTPDKVKINNLFHWRMCMAVADYVMNAPEKWNPLPGVCFYFNDKLCNPKWAQKMKKVEYNSNFNHVFYKG